MPFVSFITTPIISQPIDSSSLQLLCSSWPLSNAFQGCSVLEMAVRVSLVGSCFWHAFNDVPYGETFVFSTTQLSMLQTFAASQPSSC